MAQWSTYNRINRPIGFGFLNEPIMARLLQISPLPNQVDLWSFAAYVDNERQSKVQGEQEGGDRAQGPRETKWIGAEIRLAKCGRAKQ